MNSGRMLPGAFPSAYTLPSTQYTSSRPQPREAWSADAHRLRLEHAHWPLIAMLLLTQMAAGLHAALAAAFLSPDEAVRAAKPALSLAAFTILNLGLVVSVFHLGRPLGAWRAFLGLRTSWMSREILAFSVFAAVSAATVVASWWPFLAGFLPAVGLPLSIDPASLAPAASLAAALLGLGGIYCSAMIYIDTRRTLWRAAVTHPRFFGTSLLLGSTGAAAILAWIAALQNPSLWEFTGICIIVGTVVRTVFFGHDSITFVRALFNPLHSDHRSALTAWTFRRSLVCLAPLLFLGSTVLALAALAQQGIGAAIFASLSLALTLMSQTIERYFYFVTVVAPRMPGGVAA